MHASILVAPAQAEHLINPRRLMAATFDKIKNPVWGKLTGKTMEIQSNKQYDHHMHIWEKDFVMIENP